MLSTHVFNVPAEAMHDLFAYGTLMCADIMHAVSGCPQLAASPGLLHGYSRLCVRGEHYPGLVPRPGASVEGVVYHDLPADAWARLDRFEGDMYVRASVGVELDGAKVRRMQTYLVRPGLVGRLEDRVWELENFLHHGKAEFERAYAGYAALLASHSTRNAGDD
jgi:gamma-glutamylcyclotransferase (GGCT)/AIG2-like uncharacterized protein YtfP